MPRVNSPSSEEVLMCVLKRIFNPLSLSDLNNARFAVVYLLIAV